MRKNHLGRLGLICLALLLTACGTTPPTNFFALSAEIPDTRPASLSDDRMVIGVGPIEVSPYLERTQIVTRSDQTRLELTETNRWAEPIETNISRVIATNLSRLLPDTQPIVRPWADAGVEYHVLVKFMRFDSDLAGNVQLHANWGIQLDSSRSMPVIREAKISQASSGESYAEITRTMSAALATLSEQIAAELGEMLASSKAAASS